MSQINGVGANIDSIKTLRCYLGKHSPKYTKKVSESKTTGAGGSGQLSELDETVLDMLGRKSANFEPLKVED